jgi:hypothetical protein
MLQRLRFQTPFLPPAVWNEIADNGVRCLENELLLQTDMSGNHSIYFTQNMKISLLRPFDPNLPHKMVTMNDRGSA